MGGDDNQYPDDRSIPAYLEHGSDEEVAKKELEVLVPDEKKMLVEPAQVNRGRGRGVRTRSIGRSERIRKRKRKLKPYEEMSWQERLEFDDREEKAIERNRPTGQESVVMQPYKPRTLAEKKQMGSEGRGARRGRSQKGAAVPSGTPMYYHDHRPPRPRYTTTDLISIREKEADEEAERDDGDRSGGGGAGHGSEIPSDSLSVFEGEVNADGLMTTMEGYTSEASLKRSPPPREYAISPGILLSSSGGNGDSATTKPSGFKDEEANVNAALNAAFVSPQIAGGSPGAQSNPRSSAAGGGEDTVIGRLSVIERETQWHSSLLKTLVNSSLKQQEALDSLNRSMHTLVQELRSSQNRHKDS